MVMLGVRGAGRVRIPVGRSVPVTMRMRVPVLVRVTVVVRVFVRVGMLGRARRMVRVRSGRCGTADDDARRERERPKETRKRGSGRHEGGHVEGTSAARRTSLATKGKPLPEGPRLKSRA
jgi:hypothetical protein